MRDPRPISGHNGLHKVGRSDEDDLAFSESLTPLVGESLRIGFDGDPPQLPAGVQVATAFMRPLGISHGVNQHHNERWDPPHAYPNIAGVAYHIGEDIQGSVTDQVACAANGNVVFSDNVPSWGNLVIVEHHLTNGSIVTTIYGHMTSVFVGLGPIDIGQSIGTVGTGDGNYPVHLHFAVFLGSWDGQIPKGASGEPDDDTVYSGYVDPTAFMARFGHSSSSSNTLNGGSSVDYLFGEDGNDYISGNGGNDVLHGGTGSDNLDGGIGTDTLIGSGSADFYHIGLGRGLDTVDDQGGSGTDVIFLYGAGQVTAASQIKVGRIHEYDAYVRIYSGSGSLIGEFQIFNMAQPGGQIEELRVLGANEDREHPLFKLNLVELYRDANQVPGPAIPPTMGRGGGDAPAPVTPDSGFTWTGSSGADVNSGTNGDDVMRGLSASDTLSGGDGDDIILGNSGSDSLNGGDDDDLLIDDDQGSLSSDNLVGGRGDDTLILYGAPSGQTDLGDGGSGQDLAFVDLSNRTRDWRLTDDDGDIHIRLRSGTSEGDIELENFEAVAVLFGSGDDFAHLQSGQAYFEGGDGNDQLVSEDEDDFLDGGSGDDNLDGGKGIDWIDGGPGNDRGEVDLSDEDRNLTFVAISAASSSGFTLENGTHVRDIERIELVTGSGDDRIWLGRYDDDISTGAGDDFIFSDGLEDHDLVDGGSGWDRLVVDCSASDEELKSVYDSGADDFEISLEESYFQAEHRLRATSIEELVLLGGSADDTLRGGDGNDELFGGGGEDSLRGGDGDDWLEGGAGDDIINVGNGADWADGGSGVDTGYLDKSDSDLDFVFDARFAATDGGQTLADGTYVRKIERWNVDFGSGDDTVTTYVLGRLDIDLRSGDNTIVVDHRGQNTTLFAAPGSIINLPSFLVSVNTDYDTAIDRIWVRGADYVKVYGGSAADSISGLGSSDILDGGLGADIMAGGAGDDTFIVDNELDQAMEAVDEGRDVVYAGVSYALSLTSEIEVLSTDNIDGTSIINLTGSDFAQHIVGNAGANILDGRGGADILSGGAGNDVLRGGMGSDRLFGGSGFDTFSFASLADSRPYALRSDGVKHMPDLIGDFVSGEDRIDLSSIDAVAGTGANEAFTFIGTNAFSNVSGQVRYDVNGGFLHVFADADGDGSADLMFVMAGTSLQAADFIL